MEKIECNFYITIKEAAGADKFQAQIQVQSVRPIFDASYNSTIFNCLDEEFNFVYVEFSKIEMQEGTFLSNLSSVLAYYIYIMIGLDYDSYSKFGGTEYYKKAQAIANQAQGTEYKGWEAFSTKKSNRYWLVYQLMDPNFSTMREIIYTYHRLGLDKMSTEPESARNTIIEALLKLKKVYRDEPNSYLLQLFLMAKRDEIIKIFTDATTQEKEQIIELIKEIDGSNIGKYTDKLGVK
jgi:hypothetical protein